MIGVGADIVRLEKQEVVEVEAGALRLRAGALEREPDETRGLRLRHVEAEQHHMGAGDRVHGEPAARGLAAHASGGRLDERIDGPASAEPRVEHRHRLTHELFRPCGSFFAPEAPR